jgi:hypothetical protein
MNETRYIMLVTVDIPPEREDAWNAWYNDEHVPDILRCPGFNGVRRFRSVQGNGSRYVTIYDVESPEVRLSAEFTGKLWYRFAAGAIMSMFASAYTPSSSRHEMTSDPRR